MRWASAILFAFGAGCGPRAVDGTHPVMGLPRQALFDAPVPSEDLRSSGGGIDLSTLQNPDGVELVFQLRDLIEADSGGFARSGAVFFPMSGAIDFEGLPDLFETTSAAAAVFLIDVDPGSPDFLSRQPIDVTFNARGGPFGAPNLLVLTTVQGLPLAPERRYAAVVLRDLRDAAGAELGVSQTMAEIAGCDRPDGMPEAAHDHYQAALEALDEAGVPRDRVSGLAVFVTGDPEAQLDETLALARSFGPPTVAPWSQTDIFADYCVYESTVDMPVFQSGTPPYTRRGGGWARDVSGAPVLQRHETARLVATIPRTGMPARGYPTVVFVRTGGGGNTPLTGRGQVDPTGSVIEPGESPAMHLARAGYAGVSVDGPLGGLRNPTGGDEQFLIFNVSNAAALRDNVRQSALELALMPEVLGAVAIDVAACPGAESPAVLDADDVTLMGHSMGATIGPLAVAPEPRYRALILSGAGGSWLDNIMFKRSPIEIRPIAELILGYPQRELTLERDDPVLTLFQWATESADPPIYAERVARLPARDILMLQGIVDTYILPPIANTTSLAFGLDLAGDTLDETHPGLVEFRPLQLMLPLSGGGVIDLPTSDNRRGSTQVVVQHAEDPIQDGHEVVFQTDPPKHQYRCFLESALSGVPAVPRGAPRDADCP